MFQSNIIQRYLTKDKLIQMIEDEGLYFHNILAFLDENEGKGISWREKVEGRLFDIYNEFYANNLLDKDESKETIDQLKNVELNKKVFIQSWYSDSKPSTKMWLEYSGYGNSKDCALIIANEIQLFEKIDEKVPAGAFSKEVTYLVDKKSSIDGIFTKDIEYTDEREYRFSIDLNICSLIDHELKTALEPGKEHAKIFIGGVPFEEYAAPYYRNSGKIKKDDYIVKEKGIILKLNLKEIISKIYVPCDAGEVFVNEIDKLLKNKGYEIQCERIKVEI